MVEPRRRGVARLVQPDRLQSQLDPASRGRASARTTRRAALTCSAAWAGTPCPRPAGPARSTAAEHRRERLDQRDDAPRTARLAPLLVGRQLDRAQLQVHVRPVERPDLLMAGRPVGGERVRQGLVEGSGASRAANSSGAATRSRGLASIAGSRTSSAGLLTTSSRSCAHRYSDRSALTTLRTREPESPRRVMSSTMRCRSPRPTSRIRRRARSSGTWRSADSRSCTARRR